MPDELEGVTNGSLANITRQLSTLSRHAEEMFGNLFTQAETLAVRGSALQARIDRIAVKVGGQEFQSVFKYCLLS